MTHGGLNPQTHRPGHPSQSHATVSKHSRQSKSSTLERYETESLFPRQLSLPSISEGPDSFFPLIPVFNLLTDQDSFQQARYSSRWGQTQTTARTASLIFLVGLFFFPASSFEMISGFTYSPRSQGFRPLCTSHIPPVCLPPALCFPPILVAGDQTGHPFPRAPMRGCLSSPERHHLL